MYIPNYYNNTDINEAISFMQRFNFATIITSDNGKPIATHLPFVISKRNDNIILTSHFAKANHQAEDFQTKKILTIFTEPHAYISPKFYTKKENVPTWNYLAVHTYGTAKIIEKEADVFRVLEEMIENFEAAYKKQWDELSFQYKSRMAKGIVAFEIEVDELQFSKKLSQNKTAVEKEKIIDNFSSSQNENEKVIAELMDKDLKK